MNPIENANNSDSLAFLFGLAMVAFVLLLVIEKRKPYLHFPQKNYKESFVTNTTAFLFNNLILTVLKASSLFLVAQQFAIAWYIKQLARRASQMVIGVPSVRFGDLCVAFCQS